MFGRRDQMDQFNGYMVIRIIMDEGINGLSGQRLIGSMDQMDKGNSR